MPGSGLFKVPYENSLATEAYPYIWEDGSSSLHNLQIHVEVTAGDGTKLLFSPKLTLPGECVVIPTGLKYFNIEEPGSKMKCNALECLLKIQAQKGVANEKVPSINSMGKNKDSDVKAIGVLINEDCRSA
jgi:hypothetical protein